MAVTVITNLMFKMIRMRKNDAAKLFQLKNMNDSNDDMTNGMINGKNPLKSHCNLN